MSDYEDLVLRLEARGDTPEKQAAMSALREAGEQAKPALLAGLDHPAWRVRHGCLRVLDHTVIDDETRVRVVGALSDPHRKVRQAAMHALSCEQCKPEGFCGIEGVDIDGIYLEAATSDRSRQVRYKAMGHFLWSRELDDRVASAMRAVLSTEDDPMLRTRAAQVMAYSEASLAATTRPDRRRVYEERVAALLRAG